MVPTSRRDAHALRTCAAPQIPRPSGWRRRRPSSGTRRPDPCARSSREPFTRWFPGARLNTATTPRPPRRGRSGRSDCSDLGQSVTGSSRSTPTGTCDEVARTAGSSAGWVWPRATPSSLHAMVPRRHRHACLCRIGASTPWSSAASRRMSWPCDRRRTAQSRLLRSCGVEVDRVIGTSPSWTPPRRGGAPTGPLHHLQRPQLNGPPRGGLRARLGRRGRERRGSSLRERRGDRPAVHPVHVGNDRGSKGGGPRPRWSRGRPHWSMRNVYGVEPGDVFWAASDVGWVVGHSYIVYGPCCSAPRPSCTRASPWDARRGAFWRVVADTESSALHRADSLRAIRREDPRASTCAATTCDARHLFSPASASIRTRTTGRPICSAFRHRPLVADRDGLAVAANCVGLGALPLKPGSPPSPSRVAGSGARSDGTPKRSSTTVTCGGAADASGALSTLWRTTTGSWLLPVRYPASTDG